MSGYPVQGGPAQPVSVVNDGTTGIQGGAAQPVFVTNGMTAAQLRAALGVAQIGAPPSAYYAYASDFENAVTGTIFSSSVSGTGAAINAGSGEANHPGVASIESGTTTTGRAVALTAGTSVLLGGGATSIEGLVQVSTLSDGTDTYDVRFGLNDSNTGAPSDGVYFEYDTDSSANWRICTASAGVRTQTNTSIAVVAGAWIKLRIDINAAGTSAEFFINGSSVGTITTNIPTAAGRLTGVALQMIKSAGTTNRMLLVDYVWMYTAFTTSR